MELNYMLMGLRIRNARQARQLTQDSLSELSDISPQHMSQVESGKTKLSLPTLIKICNALEVTPDTILCDSVKAPTIAPLDEVTEIFSDCSPTEIFLMAQTAKSIKQNMRIRKMYD